MNNWKDRAISVDSLSSGGDWKNRAVPISDKPSVGGFAMNILNNAGGMINPVNIVKGLGESVYQGAYALPKDIAQSAMEVSRGQPYSGTPFAKRTVDISNSPQVQNPGKYAYENPLDAAATVAGLATPFAPEVAGNIASKAISTLPEESTLRNISNEASFRTMGGRISNAKELGPQRTRALGEFGLEKKITGYGTEGMLKSVDKVAQDAGKKLEALRLQADVVGGAPRMAEMIGKIKERLGPKYSSGIESSGQGQFNNAIDELIKANPMKEATPGDVVAFGMQESSPFGGTRPSNMNRQQAHILEKQPGFQKTSKAYESVRVKQEQGIPEYPTSEYQPTYSDYADRATRLNAYAEKQAGLLQDRTPATDVANAITQENNAGILKALGPQKYAEYQRQLKIYGNAEKAKKMILNKTSREIAGREGPGSLTRNVYQYVKDRLLDPTIAKGFSGLATSRSKLSGLADELGRR